MKETLPVGDLHRRLLQLIVFRALVLLLGLNLAARLGLLPGQAGGISFLQFFNFLTVILTFIFTLLWITHRFEKTQLYLQIGTDLVITTLLVAFTKGIQSPFLSFYLLVIIYCSLSLGSNGGKVAAALSTILYAGVIHADHLGFVVLHRSPDFASQQTIFRIASHALGFWAVALLATYLYQRLRLVEGELKDKIESLTKLQRLNEHIVGSIRSGLITTDLQGRIAVFNEAACELTGREPDEVLDHQIQHLLGEEFWSQIINAKLLDNPKPLRREQWLTLPGGTKRYLGFSVSPLLGEHQQLLGYIISFQDLTEILRLEEEIRLKDRMAAVGRMAAGIAHEIRNPLTAIRGSVEILRSHGNLPKNDQRLLEILIRESDRLNTFIENFLNFAHPRKYVKQWLDLVSITEDSVALLQNSPEVRDKYSIVLISQAPSIPVFGSVDQLNQVFWNLVQNALRAMPKGGELKIVLQKGYDGGGQIIFEDNGIGMSREELDQVFQPFHSKFRGGLGLGLSIVFQIVEDHQGKILFESERGKGTRITLCFPPVNPSEYAENPDPVQAGVQA